MRPIFESTNYSINNCSILVSLVSNVTKITGPIHNIVALSFSLFNRNYEAESVFLLNALLVP